MDERSRQRQFEEQFLNQLRARATALVRGALPADRFVVESLPDGVDATRAAMTRLEVFDRRLLDELPGTRAVQLRFQRSMFGGLVRRTIARLRAQVIAPVEALIKGEKSGPVGRDQLLDALARYDLLPRHERPTAVVFASPTGFTDSARSSVNAGPPSLILMGGRDDGGWNVDLPDALKKSAWSKLFDFESQDEQLKRLMGHLEADSGRLDSAGVAVPVLAQKLGLSREQTDALLRRAVRANPRLMTVVHEGVVHIARTPLMEEGNSMSMWSRVRRLLRMKPTVAERVREMTSQRVRVEQQRHEVDQKITALESEERSAVERGAAAATDVERRQIAGKLVRVRRDLRRLQATANVFTQQIDILGTHVHHLTLKEQGRRLELPKAEDLTREAAQAEQIMSELAANADLAHSIEVGAQTPMMADEEANILEELKQAAASRAGSVAPATASSVPMPAAPSSVRTPPIASPANAEKGKARPELG